MRSSLLSLVLVAATAITGCATPSIHPIYSTDKEATEPGIVGVWKPADENDKTIYTVSREGAAYRMVVKDGDQDKSRVSDVHLVALGQFRFADFAAPENARSKVDDEWSALFIPTHLFLRYQLNGDSLKIWALDRDWLREAVKTKKVQLACTSASDGDVIITAETPEIQAFLEANAADPNAFKPAELRRSKP